MSGGCDLEQCTADDHFEFKVLLLLDQASKRARLAGARRGAAKPMITFSFRLATIPFPHILSSSPSHVPITPTSRIGPCWKGVIISSGLL